MTSMIEDLAKDHAMLKMLAGWSHGSDSPQFLLYILCDALPVVNVPAMIRMMKITDFVYVTRKPVKEGDTIRTEDIFGEKVLAKYPDIPGLLVCRKILADGRLASVEISR